MTRISVLTITCLATTAVMAGKTRQATGVKVGEVTPTSAIIWVRHTAEPQRRPGRVENPYHDDGRLRSGVEVDQLEGACPGAPGKVRVRYANNPHLTWVKFTNWADVSAETDFTHQFLLGELEPDTEYHYGVETASPDDEPTGEMLRGRFRTAPAPSEPADVTFTVVTGMMYRDLDDPDGFHIYDAMRRLDPQFIVPTGDTVYYDNEAPRANTPALARYHWHRMYSLPRLVAFHLRVPGCWEKDDHDTLVDDCWPPRVEADELPNKFKKMLPLTFEKGQQIFREQVPMGEKTYRTTRWGRDLQVWLVEGRDFRSPNPMADGPDKTIWGKQQFAWLKRSLADSDATWKVLVSPTPIVGPDRESKADNHANAAFAHEGNAFRQWVQANVADECFIVCGDRHWQYHSVHPETGVQEFCSGPASDQHAGGTPGKDPAYHQFHRVKGGFLSVSVHREGDRPVITFRHHDVNGEVVYEHRREASTS